MKKLVLSLMTINVLAFLEAAKEFPLAWIDECKSERQKAEKIERTLSHSSDDRLAKEVGGTFNKQPPARSYTKEFLDKRNLELEFTVGEDIMPYNDLEEFEAEDAEYDEEYQEDMKSIYADGSDEVLPMPDVTEDEEDDDDEETYDPESTINQITKFTFDLLCDKMASPIEPYSLDKKGVPVNDYTNEELPFLLDKKTIRKIKKRGCVYFQNSETARLLVVKNNINTRY